jgi:hypothetical protein
MGNFLDYLGMALTIVLFGGMVIGALELYSKKYPPVDDSEKKRK